jgi:hypothetical protein
MPVDACPAQTMTRFDSDSSAVTEADSDVKHALRGATRFAERYGLELRVALAFLVVGTTGYVIHTLAHQQFGNNMGAILVWFSLIFAAASAVLGAFIKTYSAIKQRRHDWE